MGLLPWLLTFGTTIMGFFLHHHHVIPHVISFLFEFVHLFHDVEMKTVDLVVDTWNYQKDGGHGEAAEANGQSGNHMGTFHDGQNLE